MGGLAFAIKRNDERQADGHFSSRNRDNEEHKDLPIETVWGVGTETRESDERQVGRVKHQFQPHVNHEQIAPRNDAEESQRKQNRAYRQIMFQTDRHVISKLRNRASFEVLFAEQDHADHRDQENHGNDFERQKVLAKKQGAQRNSRAFESRSR